MSPFPGTWIRMACPPETPAGTVTRISNDPMQHILYFFPLPHGHFSFLFVFIAFPLPAPPLESLSSALSAFAFAVSAAILAQVSLCRSPHSSIVAPSIATPDAFPLPHGHVSFGLVFLAFPPPALPLESLSSTLTAFAFAASAAIPAHTHLMPPARSPALRLRRLTGLS